MASQTQYPSSVVSEAGGGPDWSNPSNASADDGAYASVTSASTNQVSNVLAASFTGFTIPSGQVIAGVKAQVRLYGNPEEIYDYGLQLKCGGATGNQSLIAGNGAWPTSPTTVTVGSSTEKWGLTNLTVSTVNAGLALKVKVDLFSYFYPNSTAYIDWMTLEVFYEPAPADSDKMFLMF